MSDKRKAADMQKRVATMKRNINIYLGKEKPDLTTQRLAAIKEKVQKLIDEGVIDLSLFE